MSAQNQRLLLLVLLGAFVVFGNAPAKALTFNWTTTGSGANGSGTFDIAETSVVDGGLYELTGIAGTFDGNIITTLLPVGALWSGSNNQFEYSSMSSDLLLNHGGIVFSVAGSSAYDGVELWSNVGGPDASIYGIANAVDYYNGPTMVGGTSYSITSATASLNAVPAPLPLLGLGAATAFSRKLKQRIALRRKRKEVGAVV